MKVEKQMLACLVVLAAAPMGKAFAENARTDPLYTPSSTFKTTDPIVSTPVFNWYRATSGQSSGPWRPVEGRASWTGDVDFWKRQIKDIMDANIQLMYVHLIPGDDNERQNLFRAASELRAQGYDVPKIAPFLDPQITWSSQTPIDLATPAGKDAFVGEYIRFYNHYYDANTDAFADDYLAKIDNKPVLNAWHILPPNTANRTSLTRNDVESRLAAEFAPAHPDFANGVYMVGTALHSSHLTWSDEKLVQFEAYRYYHLVTNGMTRTAQVKAGYWDQNIRDPGFQLPRDGGSHYTAAWQQANSQPNLRRVNVESWNEYDEGTGIYAGDPGAPYVGPLNHSCNTDTWSSSNNPRQYIDATAVGAGAFNGLPARDARILREDFPRRMYAGSTRNVSAVLRNEGDNEWSAGRGYKFGQQEFQPGETLFGTGRYEIDDTQDEIPLFGGIFRGRPKTFDINIVAPSGPGQYATHWAMLQEHVTWFGQVLTVPIEVLPALYGDADMDGDVDHDDLVILAGCFQTAAGADWLMADFDSDHDVDRSDLDLLAQNYAAGAPQAYADFDALIARTEPPAADPAERAAPAQTPSPNPS